MAKTKQAQKSSYPGKPATKTNGQANKQVMKKRERGGLLTFLLVLVLIHGFVATLLGFSNLKAEYTGSSWLLVGMTLVSVATVVAAVGMWNWKKWGIYLYLIASIIQMAVHLMMTGSLMVVFYDLLPVAILGYVINLQAKRDLFE